MKHSTLALPFCLLAGAVAVVASVPFLAHAQLTRTLGLGDSGSQVTQLQQYLATDSSIYPEQLVTGYYGSLTASAVGRYQCAQNIVCSGTPSTTGYGHVGPRTLASLQVALGGSVQNPPGSDISAPIMSGYQVSTSSNSATIAWTTNENARSRVMYGTSWPFLYATAPSVSAANFDTIHSVTINNLQPNTLYYFVRESIDAAGNVMWTTANAFLTTQ